MTYAPEGSVAVTETRLSHDMHREATSLLVEAAGRPSVPSAALAELRDFLVANLHHHHESEDGLLWPLITTVAPEVAEPLAALSTEHDQLDATLDALGSVPIADGTDRAALTQAATAVRDLVRHHLEQEEPLLFPALRTHLSPEAWDDFSQKVIATSPPQGAHLLIGFFDEVGTPEEVQLVLDRLPEPVRPLIPQMRRQARAALDVLRSAA
jgi:hemerythrin-like domain-containing protein